MRKWRILSALLAVLLAIGLGVSAAHVQATGRNVTFEETLLEGRAEDFAGLLVQGQYAFDGCLHWSVGYHPGRGGSTQSDVRYDAPHGMPKAQEGFWLTTGLSGMESYSSDEPLDPGIAKMIEQVRENAPSRIEPYSEVLNAEDDLTELPIRVLNAPDWLNRDAVEDFFHVPLPEHMAVQVRVFHDTGAELTAVGSGAIECWCDSVVGEDAVWFTADFVKGDEIWHPGGGVYRAADTVELLYPLSAESRTRYLSRSADGARLRLITKENDAFTLTVLDADTGAALQTLAIPVEAGKELWSTQEADGDLLLMAGEEFLLLAEAEDGTYSLAMQGSIALDEVFNGSEPWRTFAYDGDRLAVVNMSTRLLCSVYRADGSRSRMESTCSLAREDVGWTFSKTILTLWFT